MTNSDAYEAVAAMLEYPGSERLRAILEYLITPGQTQIIIHLPGTVAEVAEKSEFSEETIQKELDTLVHTGVVYPRRKPGSYRLAVNTLMLHDTTLTAETIDMTADRKLFELWEDFSINEEYPRLGKGFAAATKPMWRVVPAYKALEGLKDISPWDDFRELIKAQETIAALPCPCRLRQAGIQEPCAHTSEDRHEVCFQFGAGAQLAINRGAAQQLTTEEALERIDKIEDEGFIHTWGNSTSMDNQPHSCNCCQDCCVLYQSLAIVGESIGKVWDKSIYEAQVTQAECDGCQDCVERCHFDAIEMVKPEGPAKGRKKSQKKLKAKVDPEKCWGCGVCVLACTETKAMQFKQVRPTDHVPEPAAK